jgi:formamidopyrimidine-DNA glycosylase
MPELPEVETTLQAIKLFENKTLSSVKINNPNLRWLVDKSINKKISNKKIVSIFRRAKYLIIDLCDHYVIIHLGMSGTLRIMNRSDNYFKKHDHAEFFFKNKKLIYNDPRRFGSIHITDSYKDHFLINKLGPEPLSREFSGKYLYSVIKSSNTNIKNFIMNQKNVVGIGNIYASEILFKASIKPTRVAKSISMHECDLIAKYSKNILKRAIKVGGTTLKDFFSAEGAQGYFKIQLNVYDRADQECKKCKGVIKKIIQNQRATYFCDACQN